jgi:hypothetical protein
MVIGLEYKCEVVAEEDYFFTWNMIQYKKWIRRMQFSTKSKSTKYWAAPLISLERNISEVILQEKVNSDLTGNSKMVIFN